MPNAIRPAATAQARDAARPGRARATSADGGATGSMSALAVLAALALAALPAPVSAETGAGMSSETDADIPTETGADISAETGAGIPAKAGAGAETRPETPAERRARLLAPATGFAAPEPFEVLQGGSGTSHARADANAFSHPSGALGFEARADFFVGNGVFTRPWVAAPASTASSDGLGPLFNARSCQGCHVKDGRGHPPGPGETGMVSMVSMVMVLAGPDGAPDPRLGRQLQDRAVPGLQAEGRVRVTWKPVPFAYPNGTAATLRRPAFATDAPLAPGTALLPRMAPPMIGLGLLEAIPEADLAARADPGDRDGDGISGRLARTAAGDVGRFGWKASSPTIAHQSATAFALDMGLSTRTFPAPWGDCTRAQPACRDAPHGDATRGGGGGSQYDATDRGHPTGRADAGHAAPSRDRATGGTATAGSAAPPHDAAAPPARAPEIDPDLLDLVTFYASHLAVPARRNMDDPSVLAGKALFHEARCIACHVPKHATGADAPEGQAGQLIWPHTDLLLHDMGPGLADPAPLPGRDAAEWRTPPLWGIGLTRTVGGQAFYLHDGRARSLEEAVLWHGGEAAASRDAFAAAPAALRADLIAFLESL